MVCLFIRMLRPMRKVSSHMRLLLPARCSKKGAQKQPPARVMLALGHSRRP